MKHTIGIILLVLGALALGHFTAPVEYVDDTRKIDSLQNDIRKRERREIILRDSVNQMNILADTWFNIAQAKPKEKIITRQIFKNDKRVIDSLPDIKLDSMLLTVYPER